MILTVGIQMGRGETYFYLNVNILSITTDQNEICVSISVLLSKYAIYLDFDLIFLLIQVNLNLMQTLLLVLCKQLAVRHALTCLLSTGWGRGMSVSLPELAGVSA